jgi:hypothetical protein
VATARLLAVLAVLVAVLLFVRGSRREGLAGEGADAGYSGRERGLLRSSCKNAQQHSLYLQARARATAEGRRLVVIGDPSGGWVNKAVPIYGCGDVCIDIRGCRPCPRVGEEHTSPQVFTGDVLAGLKTVPTDSAVVFECEVFEYPEDFPAVLREVARVTGGDQSRVFATHYVALGQGTAWEYHLGGAKPPRPTSATVEVRRENRKPYAATGEGLARRIIYRYPPRDPYARVDL